MERERGPAISHFVPEPGDDVEIESIPREVINGWIKVQEYPGGFTKVYKVKTVRDLNDLAYKILYPPQKETWLRDNFGWHGKRHISEAAAYAWLRKHGWPVPGENGVGSDNHTDEQAMEEER